LKRLMLMLVQHTATLAQSGRTRISPTRLALSA
jgi:hypothetical protein